jgi:hypothetical protein
MMQAITVYVKPEAYELVLRQLAQNWVQGGVICGLIAPSGLYYWRKYYQASNLVQNEVPTWRVS